MIGERKIVWNKKRPRSPIGDPEKAKKEANGPGYLTNGKEGKRSAHPQPKTEEGQIMGQGGSQSKGQKEETVQVPMPEVQGRNNKGPEKRPMPDLPAMGPCDLPGHLGQAV